MKESAVQAERTSVHTAPPPARAHSGPSRSGLTRSGSLLTRCTNNTVEAQTQEGLQAGGCWVKPVCNGSTRGPAKVTRTVNTQQRPRG